MDKRMAEAHIEWIEDTDPEPLIRALMMRLGWIDPTALLQMAGGDSFLVELNEATWEELESEGFIEYEDDRITFGIEFEDEDDTAGFMIPQDR